MSNQDVNVEQEKKTILVDWNVGDDNLITPFATNMVIQTIESVFKLSFFEMKPAIILDTSLPLPTSIRADRVASVFVAADKLQNIIQIMQDQLDKYNSTKPVE